MRPSASGKQEPVPHLAKSGHDLGKHSLAQLLDDVAQSAAGDANVLQVV